MGGLGHMIYAICYYAGVQTVRLLHRFGRFFAFILHPLTLLTRRAMGAIFGGLSEQVSAFFRAVRNGLTRAGERIGTGWKRHPVRGVLEVLLVPFLALRRHPRAVRALLRVTAFAVAGVMLVLTMRYWNGLTYALALKSGGDVWGYVADETVLQAGADMAAERVSGSWQMQELNTQPTMELSMVHQDEILDKTQVCDLLLTRSELSLIRACGIYVDGVLQGAVYAYSQAENLLEEILEESREGRPGVTASFFQEVELIEGLYPQQSVVVPDTMKKNLVTKGAAKEFYQVKEGDTLGSAAENAGVTVADILRLNPGIGFALQEGQTLLIRDSEPHLKVLVSGTIEYDVELPYTTQRVANASEYKGYERTVVNGENGVSRVTATATYLDGEELSCVITSSTVVKEPVNKVIAYGTKELKSKKYKGGPYATGQFMWPVPYTRYITQYFESASSHGALDIAAHNIRGQNIIAADGGEVVVASWRKGTSYATYGLYVEIDHGGGYRTLYAHCDELFVEVGDIVKQGDVIGTVGNTGKSTGPHLHFEIKVNGRRVNPLTFF